MNGLTGLHRFAYRSIRRAGREWQAIHTGRRLQEMLAAGGPAAALARAFQLGQSADAETLRWQARIEAERARLQEDPTEIVILGPDGDILAQLTVAEACAASIAPPAGALLHALVREFRPRIALEMGTNIGISASYLASALPADGKLITLEGSVERLEHAKKLHARFGLNQIDHRLGSFGDTLQPTLDEIGTVDFAFIDGHHHFEPTLSYFDQICAHAATDAVFVFDDIRWSVGMRAAWKTVKVDPRISVAVDLHWMGVCVAGPDRSDGAALSSSLELWLERGKER